MEQSLAEEVLEAHDDFAGADHVVQVPGMSSPRVCRFLNQLVGRLDPGQAYLEIGTWQGLTLLSAAHGNRGRLCVACDKFRFWGRFTGWGHRVRRSFYRNLQRLHGPQDATIAFYEMPSEKMFARGLAPHGVGVYFFDGDHSYQGTYDGIFAASHLLSADSTLLVDDWNDPVIQRASHDAIRDAGLTVTWSRELEGSRDLSGWWNGLGVFSLRK